MKTTRKILAILCAAAMLFSLAACGSTTSTPVTTSEPTASADNEEATSADASAPADAPEKPDGEPGEKPDGEPPEKPDGASGEKPDGQPGGQGGAPGGQGSGLGGSSEVTQGSSANTITEDGTYSGTTYSSTKSLCAWTVRPSRSTAAPSRRARVPHPIPKTATFTA